MTNMPSEYLTDAEIHRQDLVDNAIYELLRQTNPSGKEIKWDTNIISYVREAVQYCLVDKLRITDAQTFYPYLEEF